MSSRPRPSSIVALAVLLVCAAAQPGLAADDDPQPRILNCGDPGWRDLCFECCPECDGTEPEPRLICCYTPDECTIINEPPTTGLTGADVSITHAYSGLKLALKRKEIVRGGELLVKISLKGQLVTPAVRKRLAVKGTITGADASVGSLAYAVAFVGMGDAALDRLRAQGKDVALALSGTPLVCDASFTSSDCQLLAVQLSKLIDGALPADGDERTGFLESVAPLGFAPCSTRAP